MDVAQRVRGVDTPTNLDEEGFPQLGSVVRGIPFSHEGAVRGSRPSSSSSSSSDQESGETTRRRVVILRPLPSTPKQSSSQSKISIDASADHVINKDSMSLSPNPRRRRKTSKGFKVKHRANSEIKSSTNSKLCINVWKEYFLGIGVLHPQIIQFKPKENGCDTWYQLWCAYCEIIRSCSYYTMWIGRFLLFALRIFQPVVGGKLHFCYLTKIHHNIHQEGDERRLDIQFIGSPFQSITLYLARIMCPFCAQESQARLSLKYFQNTVAERRSSLGT